MTADPGEYHRDSGPRMADRNTPIPDPTRLTTEALHRELAALRELLEARLAAMDRATGLVAQRVDQARAEVAAQREHLLGDADRMRAAQREYLLAQIDGVRNVTAEKFDAVNTRFLERDTRTEQAAQESRISLDAALAAAKEAVSEQNKANAQAIAKSEVATQKQIDAMGALMTTSLKSLEDKIGDATKRLDKGEGAGAGASEYRTEKRLDAGQVLMAISVLAAVILGIIAIFHK